MKDLVIIPTIPTVNLSNLNRSPSSSNPCSPSTNKTSLNLAGVLNNGLLNNPNNNNNTPYEFDGCMLCVNGTPSCLQKRRATWTLKLRVALYCLSVLHPEKKYFNLKKDIYTYVDSHWDFLSINTAKSDRWRKQVQDSLSHCRHFESGWDAMGCNGHWRLIHPLNPWSLPPDKESQIYEDEDSIGSLTPDAGLSPRTTKSPREDPLYRNFPKRRVSTGMSVGIEEISSNQEIHINESRKRKANDEDRYTEEELLLLKYSPMIFSDTPSPKCRTPRSSQSSTSPSILGNSPLLTSSGAHLSLSNFYNNLNLNSSGNNYPQHQQPQQQHTNLTILEQPHSPISPPLSPSNSMRSNSSPPIPTNPFAQNWKQSQPQQQSPVLFGNEQLDTNIKMTPLPNPFSIKSSHLIHPNNQSCGIGNNNLKVPSELLLKSSIFNSTNINRGNNIINNTTTSAELNITRENNAISTLLSVAASTSSTPINNLTGSNSNMNQDVNNSSQPKLTKLQQQNLILNCTY